MLTLRDLNRATLARQHLLSRHEGDVADVVHRAEPAPAGVPAPVRFLPEAKLLISPFAATDLGQVEEKGLRLPAFAEPDATTTALEVTGAQ
ncbi:hypothetical protein AB0K18_24670 [Nonomuraea sp. NPDC049421]|uniref:hypothetical protein n=1 Tax=Nonomuraea sp. NPDC049421 TaxID=3155275 RepID=UPI003412C82C